MTEFPTTMDDRQRATPYASALEAQEARDTVNLMVPGHGATPSGLSQELSRFCGERALAMDIPPLIDGIDVGPASAFVQATRLAAEAWGARRTWFLTNGASQANRMAALALAGLHRGDTVVAQRSAHSSFTDGVLLGDLLPRFVFPSIDEERGINHGVDPRALDEALTRAASDDDVIAAVYVISPSYFGAVADVAALAEVAHRHGAPLVVDGAWGSHFGFHPALPESPARLGADITVSSTHKLGGSLTQSAMLHLGDGPFAAALEPMLDRAYMLTQSTSASALLLGSLDVARHALVHGGELIGETLAVVEDLRGALRDDGRYTIISDGFSAFPDIVAHDPLRVSIDVSSTGLSGHRMRDVLSADYGVYLEISTAQAVVAFIGPGKRPDLSRFSRALFEIADRADRAPTPEVFDFPALPQPVPMLMRPRSAYFSRHEIVSASEAVGRISADSLAAYPPGIPNVIPGEAITAETVAFLQTVAASPIGYVRGALDASLSRFRVVTETT
ncbi:aminotransferase class I/II-fold pyridoxal phosphate-dependent enzyme [Leucobacter sp. wl10]|uniref:aminotransferase class I/II-fold pyridoxal phosphate-dependent enzyme n=1 Tax=Leucobacter sp. wl10 TaxID=2304677 RepID=UPI000E5B2F41|nr:aminotransferase class V-fold PLP-dependent enzyme [Leucobacter sp. wl10]RGE23120.1 aminotransferase class V-fold PLP-dependent enzyme [Leucobacter sp. wl10]